MSLTETLGSELVSALDLDENFKGLVTPSSPDTPLQFHLNLDTDFIKRKLPTLSLSTSAPASPVSPQKTFARQLFVPQVPSYSLSPRMPMRQRSVSGDLAPPMASTYGSAQYYFDNSFDALDGNSSSGSMGSRFDQPVRKTTLYKTELCRTFDEFGSCRYGPKCQFAHSLAELQTIDRHPKYKTQMCKTFWENGHCPYGRRCCFIHPDGNDRILDKETMDLKSPRTRSFSEGSALGTANSGRPRLLEPLSARVRSQQEYDAFHSHDYHSSMDALSFQSSIDEMTARVQSLEMSSLSFDDFNGAAGTPSSTPVNYAPIHSRSRYVSTRGLFFGEMDDKNLAAPVSSEHLTAQLMAIAEDSSFQWN